MTDARRLRHPNGAVRMGFPAELRSADGVRGFSRLGARSASKGWPCWRCGLVGERPPVMSGLNEAEKRACARLVELALEEDLQTAGDLTCAAIIPPGLEGAAVRVTLI